MTNSKTNDWQDISTAPRDGTAILAEIRGHGFGKIAWNGDLLDCGGESCGAWEHLGEMPPDSWADGICWERNAEGVPSEQPVRWTTLATPPPCPLCDQPMHFIHGGGWDYDRWLCHAVAKESFGVRKFCEGEIELESTTYIDDEDAQ
jgi:hypothetical protein